jgi:hypothetical protein
MRRGNQWIAALIIGTGLALTGCGQQSQASGDAGGTKPVKVETVANSDIKRLILTQAAYDRLAIQTVPVEAAPSLVVMPAGAPAPDPTKTVVPYIAVLYDTTGGTWVYTMPQPLTFVRHKVVVVRVFGDNATLSAGPAVGTAVVTKGVPELYGAELGVGK